MSSEVSFSNCFPLSFFLQTSATILLFSSHKILQLMVDNPLTAKCPKGISCPIFLYDKPICLVTSLFYKPALPSQPSCSERGDKSALFGTAAFHPPEVSVFFIRHWSSHLRIWCYLFPIVANYLLPLQGLSKSPTVITLCQVRDGVAGNHGNHRQLCRYKEENKRMIKRCPFEQFLLCLYNGANFIYVLYVFECIALK